MPNKQRKALHALILIFVAVGFIIHYTPYKNDGITPLCFVGAIAIHSQIVWGTWRTAVYIIIAALLSYCAECIGVNTSHIFGAYHYNANLPGLIYGVPFYVPFSYVYLVYTTNFICLAISKPMSYKRNVLVLAAMSGIIMMMHDLAIDPIFSTINHIWTWDQKGAISGVPIHNFTGWFVVFFTITLVATLSTWHVKDRCRNLVISKSVLLLPMLLFIAVTCFGITDALGSMPDDRNISGICVFISLFGLSPYLLLAWFNGFRSNPDK
jgi:uncharacterized membrane protein